MSNYMGDLAAYSAYTAGNSNIVDSDIKVVKRGSSEDTSNLDMTDFLTLMVAQFQNQSIDNTADTSDMLNQLVQMSVVQAITNITDATVMMYAGSLVGKEVTVGQYNQDGTLEEIVGLVTGTGVSGGQQVVFVDGKSYYLSDIMAVGRLPELEMPETETDENLKPQPTEPDEGEPESTEPPVETAEETDTSGETGDTSSGADPGL